MTQKHSSRAKSFANFALKLGFVAGLLYWLSQKGFLSLEATRNAFSHYEFIIPAAIAQSVCVALGIIRWQWLLRAQGIQLSWRRVTELTFIGQFFNIAFPGAVSGDVIKAFFIAKETHVQRGHTFGTIVFDRIVGVSAMVFLSAASLVMGIGSLWGTPLFKAIQFSIVVAASGAFAFYLYLFLLSENRDPVLYVLKHLEQRFKPAGSVLRIYEGVRHYHNHRATVVKSIAISVVIHLLISYACLQYAHALGDGDIPLVSLYTVVPLGLLVTAIPIAPAGVGTGHAAFLALFHFLGSERGADVFSMMTIMTFLFGGIGGLVYLRFKSKDPLSIQAMRQEASDSGSATNPAQA